MMLCYGFFIVFFFKQKTAYEMRISDWSSDVCSSDLGGADPEGGQRCDRAGGTVRRRPVQPDDQVGRRAALAEGGGLPRHRGPRLPPPARARSWPPRPRPWPTRAWTRRARPRDNPTQLPSHPHTHPTPPPDLLRTAPPAH